MGVTLQMMLYHPSWLTGYGVEDIEALMDEGVPYGDFFRNASCLNRSRSVDAICSRLVYSHVASSI